MAISLTRTKGERRPKHRAVDRVEFLEGELAEAKQWRRQLSTECDEYACKVIELANEIDGEKTARQAAEETAESLAGELAAAAEEIERLRRQLAPYLAAEANEQAVSVPAWVRDTSAEEDRATAPLDVAELRDTHNTTATAWKASDTRVIPLQQRGDEDEKGAA